MHIQKIAVSLHHNNKQIEIMATIKKPSKAQVKRECDKDLLKIQNALNSGAKLVETNFYNKVEYGVEYPTGGYFKISKTIYNKFNK